jgi:8-oxo-dGTP diphosphatase
LEESGHRLRPTCTSCGFIQFKNPAPTVSILIVKGDRVLLGKRGGPPGRTKWAIPSGYVEYEDDFLTTAIREVKEETGLDVEIQSLLNVVSSFLSPRFHFLAIYLLAHVVGGELRAGDDLVEAEWFSLSEPLPGMAFVEDVAALELYAAKGSSGLPVDPEFAQPGPR